MRGQDPRPTGAARPRASRRSSQRRGSLLAADSFPVVGLGASAGGLDAFRRLLAVLPAGTGMAFILIQHLDPTHASMMVDLLAGHTPLTVQQAADGMPIEPEHVYLIPPGAYLSIRAGALRLSQPRERHGARLPFDFFLRSLADELGERAICVILSGTGSDGSLGLKAVKEKGGLVIAQEPSEAEYDGMPRSAIMTGAVDLVLPVAEIPGILAKYAGRKGLPPDDHPPDQLAEIVNLVRSKTSHDFGLYKPGTLSRRIERRMALAGIDDSSRYLDMLRENPAELDLLAKDLLINVTSFFRDPKAFELLAEEVIPDLVRRHPRGPAAADLGCRLQHRRGDLFPRDTVYRGDHGGEAEHQAAGLRLRCRRGRGRSRPRGALSGIDRGGCVAAAARPLLYPGGARPSGRARVARGGGIHGPGCAGRSAVLAARSDLLP